MFRARLQSSLYVKSHAQVHCFVQSTVALEQIKEYSELKREPPQIMELRPDASWFKGVSIAKTWAIKYAACAIDPLFIVMCAQ